MQWDIKPYTNERVRRRRGVPPRPPGSQPRRRRPLSFVYGLMSHCIDRFHFVFYLYTFHFMLPMCILFTSWKSFVCIHKNYLSIYLYAIYTPPNFITMIICIESKKQSDYCQLNKPCSTSSWVSKKNIKNLILFYLDLNFELW